MILQLRSSSQSVDRQLGNIDVVHLDSDGILTVHNKDAQIWTEVLWQIVTRHGIYYTEPNEQIEYDEFCLVFEEPTST